MGYVTECKNKTVYYSRSQAERVRRRLEGRKGEELRAYPCRHCGHFHLTSQIVGGRRRRSKKFGRDKAR